MQLLYGENQVPVLAPYDVAVLDGEAAALGFAASLVEELAGVEVLVVLRVGMAKRMRSALPLRLSKNCAPATIFRFWHSRAMLAMWPMVLMSN